ncbi:hypothetical protein ACKAV7_008441 [Fusarium commune]
MAAFQFRSEHGQSLHETSHSSEKGEIESLDDDMVIFTDKTNCIRAVAVTPLIRRVVEISGSATSIHALIIGRVLMGVGYAGIYQLNLVFVSIFADSKEATRIAAAVGLSWAVGIIVGPFVGAGFAENQNVTWRWAFYINLPFFGLLLCVAAIFLPSFNIGSSRSLRKSLSKFDLIGSVLHCAVSLYYLPIFYAFACGVSSIEAAVHIVPFIGFFIGSIIPASIGLPLVGYYAVFSLLAGIIMLVGGALMTTITSATPDQTILGYQVLLAIGIGLVFSNAYSVANASLDNPRERINSTTLFSMALISGVCLALSVAGCVYHNLGSSSLQEEL